MDQFLKVPLRDVIVDALVVSVLAISVLLRLVVEAHVRHVVSPSPLSREGRLSDPACACMTKMGGVEELERKGHMSGVTREKTQRHETA